MTGTPIELICFPGAPNLPIFAATEKGFFEGAGVAVNLETTPNSSYQAENLANGTFQMAGTAFDNVVAYREGQGAVKLDPAPDLFAFMGATQIELSLIVVPDVQTFADLKGRSLALDALNTGFAFVLYEMLKTGGLAEDDCLRVPVGATPLRWESVRDGLHAGTLTIEPFTSIAEAQGFRVLARSTDLYPSYQGGVFTASRAWAAANADTVKGFIRGYLDGLAWTTDPANRRDAAEMLMRNMPAIKPGVVDRVMDNLLSPRSGLTPRAEILMDGVRTVLELRAAHAGGPIAVDDPSRYVDLSYYDAVVKSG